MSQKVVILAGGEGSRLAPYTTVLPKPLMPVGEIPILEVILNQLSRQGFRDVNLAVGHLGALIQAYFGDGSRHGLSLNYFQEERPLGTAGPLRLIPGLTETFLVMNGDILTDLNYRALLEYHITSRPIATISTHRRSVKVDFGVMSLSRDDRLTGYDEKPTLSYQVSMGIYVFEPGIFKYIKEGERLDFPDLISRLLEAGERVMSYKYEGYWLDIGRPADYEQAVKDLAKMPDRFLKR
jgi:NDP-sugar pyrophosphorylase family protein